VSVTYDFISPIVQQSPQPFNNMWDFFLFLRLWKLFNKEFSFLALVVQLPALVAQLLALVEQ
jgi:hypothetical protein